MTRSWRRPPLRILAAAAAAASASASPLSPRLPYPAAAILALPPPDALPLALADSRIPPPPPPRLVRHWYPPPTSRSVGFRPTGNRALSGSGSFPSPARSVDVDLGDGSGDVIYVVGVSVSVGGEGGGGGGGAGGGAGRFRFVATTDGGEAYAVGPASVDDDDGGAWAARPVEDYAPPSPESPPVVRAASGSERGGSEGEGESGAPEVVRLGSGADLSPLSPPVAVDLAPGGRDLYAFASSSGDLVLWDASPTASPAADDDDAAGRELDRIVGVGAPPDGRIVVSPEGGDGGTPPLLALYGGSTDSYRHCVLGDCIEATRLLLVRVDADAGSSGGGADGTESPPRLAVEADVRLVGGEVFEGLNPFFTDDGRTVVATVSDDEKGGRLRAYSRDGTAMSESPHLGWGWRHQLFHADMGPTNASAGVPVPCLVDVLTPHVGKLVEFFDMSSRPTMALRASASPYTTHRMGSRNLDTGLGADLDGDGIREAVVMGGDFTELVGIQLRPRADGGVGGWDGVLRAGEVWRVPLPGRLTSNLAAMDSFDGGGVAVAAASGRTLRIWLPREDGARTGTDGDHDDEDDSGGVEGTDGGDGDGDVQNATGVPNLTHEHDNRTAHSGTSRFAMSPTRAATHLLMPILCPLLLSLTMTTAIC